MVAATKAPSIERFARRPKPGVPGVDHRDDDRVASRPSTVGAGPQGHPARAGRVQRQMRPSVVGVLSGSGPPLTTGPAHSPTVVQRQVAGQQVVQRQPQVRGGAQQPPSRLATSAFWGAYQRIGYNVWQGEENRDEVWKFVGGNVGKAFAGQNTCATRVSYALDYGGAPIAHYDGTTSFHNDPGTTFAGKAGDGKNYIVGAPAMDAYLTAHWGAPDARLATGAEATAFAGTLVGNQGAVFAGAHHAGLIMKGYTDPYVFGDPGVLPVHVWKLP